MSGKISGQVWDLDLPHNETFVLLAIADKVDHEGKNAYPGIDLLRWMTGYSERQVRRIISQLEDKRILIRRNRGRRGEGFAVYDIDLTRAPQKAPRRARSEPKTTGQNVRLNPVEKPVENNFQPDISDASTGHLGTSQPDIIPESDSSHLLLCEPSLEPSYRNVHDQGPVENSPVFPATTGAQVLANAKIIETTSLQIVGETPRWTLAPNDPGGLPIGVVRELCGDKEEEIRRLVGFLVDSQFSGLAFFQLAEIIKARVPTKRINSVGYYFPETRRVEQLCHLALARRERLDLLAGSTPQERWENELSVVRRMVDRWRRG